MEVELNETKEREQKLMEQVASLEQKLLEQAEQLALADSATKE